MAKEKLNLVPPIQFVFIMWVVFTLQYNLFFDFTPWGILPRTWVGLIGIPIAPFIHGSVQHIMSNSLPVLTLGAGLYYFYPAYAQQVFMAGILLTNLFVWLVARPFIHIGSSGLVYSLGFFLISMGFFKRDFRSIIISLLVIVIYGGVLYSGALIDERVSYESHLIGALVGIAMAFGIVKTKKG